MRSYFCPCHGYKILYLSKQKNERLLFSQVNHFNDKKQKSNYIYFSMVIFMYNSMTGYQLVQRLSKNYTYQLHAITYKDKECLSAHWLSLYS